MAKKDDFKNAAAMFIDTASDLREEHKPKKAPEPAKQPTKTDMDADTETMEKIKSYLTEKGLKMVRSEARSKKLHISVTPTLAEAIKGRAEKEQRSQNEIINEVLEQAFLFSEN